jgi:hypothetical protein
MKSLGNLDYLACKSRCFLRNYGARRTGTMDAWLAVDAEKTRRTSAAHQAVTDAAVMTRSKTSLAQQTIADLAVGSPKLLKHPSVF